MCWYERTVYVYLCGHRVPMDDTRMVRCGRRGCTTLEYQVVDNPVRLNYNCSGCNHPRR
jgi:hypothetical protein